MFKWKTPPFLTDRGPNLGSGLFWFVVDIPFLLAVCLRLILKNDPYLHLNLLELCLGLKQTHMCRQDLATNLEKETNRAPESGSKQYFAIDTSDIQLQGPERRSRRGGCSWTGAKSQLNFECSLDLIESRILFVWNSVSAEVRPRIAKRSWPIVMLNKVRSCETPWACLSKRFAGLEKSRTERNHSQFMAEEKEANHFCRRTSALSMMHDSQH